MTSNVQTVKSLVDELNEEDLCKVIEHIAKKIWIPIHVSRKKFDIPSQDFQSLINDVELNSKIDDLACYLLQNRFENEETETTSSTKSIEDNVAEVELDNDTTMTVEGLFDLIVSDNKK